MPRPTHQDAEMIFNLLGLVGSERFQEARSWFIREFSASSYEEFVKKYPEGSKDYGYVTTVLGFYEVAGALLTHGLVNEDLFFDIAFGFPQIWKRIGPIIPGWQKATIPALWKNTVWMAE